MPTNAVHDHNQAPAPTVRKDRIGRNRPPATPIALARTPGPGPWVTQARCRGLPREAFFPGRGEDLDPARAICAECPVIGQCQEYAIPISELHGVWGGLSENERRRVRKARAIAAKSPPQVAKPPAPASEVEAPAAKPTRLRAPAGTLETNLAKATRRPGRWVAVAHFQAQGSASSTASLLRRGRRPLPAGCWEFEARRRAHGGSELWARYAPAPTPHQLHAVGQ
jgi:hypothetical protein